MSSVDEVKPVFFSHELGCLYQSGYKQLEGMRPEKRAWLENELSMALAVSPHVTDLVVPTAHRPFGDNKQWMGPSWDLQKDIWSAAGLLAQGRNVMVYCYYGRNRSGLVAALIIRELMGTTGAEALQLLRRARRGSVGGNTHFVNYLEGLGPP